MVLLVQVRTPFIFILCCWSLACLSAARSAAARSDEHPEPSSLIQPKTSLRVLKRGRPFPLRCVMEDDTLHVALLEASPGLKRIEFEWIVPWNEGSVDPRYKSEATELGMKHTYSVSLRGPELPDTVPLPTTPRKTRVLVRVEADKGSTYWDETVKSCWTGRRVQKPGPIRKLETFSFERIIAIVHLPKTPNGPLDGLILRWCPKSDPNCRPEDVLFNKQITNVEYSFSTLIEPMEDHESEDHELCATAYNIRQRERLLGPMSCMSVSFVNGNS